MSRFVKMDAEIIENSLSLEKMKISKENNNKDNKSALPNGYHSNNHSLSNGDTTSNNEDTASFSSANSENNTDNTYNKSCSDSECSIDTKNDTSILKSDTGQTVNNIDCNSKNDDSSVAMMSLDSNNSLFLRPKATNETAIFANQNLPAFLEHSLNEQLSKIIIDSDNDNMEKVIEMIPYENEKQLPDLMSLISKDLSEPYSVYTYRYFLHNWPELSFLAYCENTCVGAIVCKLDQHRKNIWRGYIAMLVVHEDYRRCKIGTKLVQRAIRKMINQGCDEVVLETEVTNKSALKLYENLGFVRDKRLLRYYLNGVDAWRLKLWLK